MPKKTFPASHLPVQGTQEMASQGVQFKKLSGAECPRTSLKIRAYGAHLRAFGAQVRLFQFSIRHFKMLPKTLLAHR